MRGTVVSEGEGDGVEGEGGADRSEPVPHRPGTQDGFWVGVLVLIVVVLLLVVVFSHLDMDTGPPTQDWNNVWH